MQCVLKCNERGISREPDVSSDQLVVKFVAIVNFKFTQSVIIMTQYVLLQHSLDNVFRKLFATKSNNIILEISDGRFGCFKLTSFDLGQRVDQPTHDQNGILDVIITRTDLPPQIIKVTDICLSDHRLVQWSLELDTTTPVYETISRRAWMSFNTDAFKI